ncbi:MAG: porin, partial [Planctomycetota bacterium]|nr:porin [Planctomycetota bacterium]
MKALWSLAILFGLSTTLFAQDEAATPNVTPDAKDEAVLFEGEDVKVYWKNGTRIEGDDFKIKFGGRIHNDWKFESGDLDNENGTEFRRARLFFSGTLYDRIVFKAQYDFEDGQSDFKDVYIGVKGLPFAGTLTIGQQFESFGFNAPPSNYYTFMEGPLDSSISPQHSTGIKMQNSVLEEKLQYSLGFFWGNSDGFGEDTSNDGDMDITGRITGLPIYEKDEMLLHVGASVSRRHNHGGDDINFESKPMANLSSDWVLSAVTGVEDLMLLGFELGFAWQSLHAQFEFVNWDASAIDSANDVTYSALYLQVGYFLTGEIRPYSAKKGMWSRVKPLKNAFGEEGGWGAWELKARVQMVNGEDSGAGNDMTNIALGANWYLNSATRVMLEYINTSVDNGSTT